MSRITDEDIVQAARDGLLRLAPGPVVQKWHRGTRKWVTLRHRGDSNGSHRRQYLLRFGGASGSRWRGRTIAAARLVWLLHHMTAPPPGFDVDHINDDASDDRPENLQLLPVGVNRSHPGRVWLEVCSYFDRIVARRYGSCGDY